MKKLISFVLIFYVLLIHDDLAQVPGMMNYQGVLTDASGAAVSDGNYNLTFSLYNVSTGGAALWTEHHTTVLVINGIFNVILGSAGSPINRAFDVQYYLGITVTPPGTELSPRIALTSSAYAFNVKAVNGATIDNSAIGSTTPNTGDFTSLSANNGLTVSNGSVQMFGAWETKSEGQVYQASTDGLVLAVASNSGVSQVLLSGFTDSNSNPTTLRIGQLATRDGDTGGFSVSIIMPVRKGDYWKVTTFQGAADFVYWIPLGN